VLFNITNTLFFFCIDIFIEHFSDKKNIGKVHGVYLTVYNVAWMISPFITGMLASGGHGYIPVYICAFITAIITMVGFILWVPSFRDASYSKVPFFQAYKFIRDKHHLASINIINFILQFFFVWMVIYTPIYLVEHLGFSWENIGVMFTYMLAPFVVIPLSLGVIIDKYKLHKRNLIVIGTIIMSISTICITFMDTKSIMFWALILCMTRVGAAIVETASEMYFFTHVKEEDAQLLSIYRDMSPLSYLIAPLLGTAVLLFFPFKYLFIILGILVLCIVYYVPRLKHSKNELHISH
jgi:MFS family permease